MLNIGRNLDPRFVSLLNSFPEKILKLNGIRDVDPFQLADEYYNSQIVADMSIDPNANVSGKSPVNFISEIFKPLTKIRSMHTAWKMIEKKHGEQIANECLTACFNGKLYHHDWTKYDVPYCFAPDSSFWMLEGRPYGWLPGSAPNKLRSFIGQTIEVAMDMSQEHAGAIGIANILVNAAYFVKKDKEQIRKAISQMVEMGLKDDQIIEIVARLFSHSNEDFIKKMNKAKGCDNLDKAVMSIYEKEVEDVLQQLVHVFHNTFRIGGDSPFTNLSIFCRETILRTFKDATYPDGSKPVDNIDEIMSVQLVFARFFSEGSPLSGKSYRFPVCTVNVYAKPREQFTAEEMVQYPNHKCLIVDRDFFRVLCRLNAKRGVFNFHKGEKLASCCRLTSDLAELRSQIRMDSFGNGGMSIGSHRVVALNLHSIMCEAIETGVPFRSVLEKYQAYAEILLVAHKKWLEFIINTGTLKFFNINWQDLKMFFSTFGFTGLRDSYKLLHRSGSLEDYRKFAKTTLAQMDNYSREAGRRNEGFAFNVEEIPGENASPKLAAIDNFYYGDKPWYENVELLSNQMVPLYEDVDAFERLEVMGDLMDDVSGGAICHYNVDGSMTEEASIRLAEMMIEEYNITHFAIEIGSSTCKNGHTNEGIHLQCPTCGGEIDTWTRRVVGFNTDTKDWHYVRRDWENLRRKIYGQEELGLKG